MRSSIVVIILAFCGLAEASPPTSFRQPHPLNWMYALPTGEAPGWTGKSWLYLETGHSNVWNAPLKMKNRKTQAEYEYSADYEQLTGVLEFGKAVADRLAISLEIPFAYRSGGFFDGFIENFHDLIGSRSYNRPAYPENEYSYSVKTGTEDYYRDQQLNGVANLKPKVKLWLAKWENKKGACPCGISVSAQYKIPIQSAAYAGTNGKGNASGLLHIGVPLGKTSALWATGAYTRLADNPAMPGWPLLKDHQMYELNFDLGFSDRWGLLFLLRMESPFLDVDQLQYVDSETNKKMRAENRASSGWNSLVRWQGANGLGFRYRPSDTFQLNFYAVEDWGIGPYDADDQIYSNGAPDFNFLFKIAKSF